METAVERRKFRVNIETGPGRGSLGEIVFNGGYCAILTAAARGLFGLLKMGVARRDSRPIALVRVIHRIKSRGIQLQYCPE